MNRTNLYTYEELEEKYFKLMDIIVRDSAEYRELSKKYIDLLNGQSTVETFDAKFYDENGIQIFGHAKITKADVEELKRCSKV
jgi:hypothetical protein